MDTTENLAAAIREIQTTARAAAEPCIETISVDDGAGGALEVPVATSVDSDGQIKAVSLLEEIKKGAEYAKAARLAKALAPDRRKGVALLQSFGSFVAHANRFKAPHSAIWADATNRKLVSVLNYNPEGADTSPLWGDHRGIYACPLSDAWKAWGGGQALTLGQDEFAALLDGRDRELSSGKLPSGKEAPQPASLVTLANSLEVYSSATAKRERDPNTGRLKISFTEDKGVNGDVVVPPAFLICVPIFQDGAPELLEVRLRVTVKEGQALFAVQIHAADELLRGAFGRLCGEAGAGTGLPVFIGAPE